MTGRMDKAMAMAAVDHKIHRTLAVAVAVAAVAVAAVVVAGRRTLMNKSKAS